VGEEVIPHSIRYHYLALDLDRKFFVGGNCWMEKERVCSRTSKGMWGFGLITRISISTEE
jgi:hypothetical protein